jgi:hypothetical protein
VDGGEREHAMDEKLLKDVYEFDDEDLNANRSGRLSEKQLERLKQKNQFLKAGGKKAGRYFFGIAAILPLCMVPVGFLTLFISKDWPHTLEAWGASLLWLLIFGGIAIFLGSAGKTKAQVLLRTARGPVEIKKYNEQSSNGKRYIQYQFVVGNYEFVLDDELVGKVKQGESYAVYFIDYQDGTEGIIQSMEKLPDA